MIRTLNKLNAGEYLDLVLRSNVFSLQQSGAALLDKYEAFVASLPEVEIQRLIRTAQTGRLTLGRDPIPRRGIGSPSWRIMRSRKPALRLSESEIRALG